MLSSDQASQPVYNSSKLLAVSNDTGKLKDLLDCLDGHKDGPLTDADEHVMVTGNLCEALKTITSRMYYDLECLSREFQKVAKHKIKIDDLQRWEESIREAAYQIDSLAEVIKDRIRPYREVEDILYFYDNLVKGRGSSLTV